MALISKSSSVSNWLSLLSPFSLFYNQLGQGKFSYVFKAKQTTNGAMVALKLIKVSQVIQSQSFQTLIWKAQSSIHTNWETDN